jgi:Fe-S oxidoreductase
MFGDTIYETFRRIKHAFDPENRFNPGKIVDAPAMTENLRIGPEYHAHEPATIFDYSRQEGFARAVEMCNGSGACRKLQGGTMCPSYRATRDEADSTRGRANALRLAMSGESPFDELRSDWLHRVLDLCLMCKACKAECPSNVDLAKLKSEFLQLYHKVHARPMDHWLLSRQHHWMPAVARFAPLVNRLSSNWMARWLLDRLVGVDRRRSLPQVHSDHFRRWFADHSRLMSAGSRRTAAVNNRPNVLLLDDCFTTFQEPQIGKAAVVVLERAGIGVELTSDLVATAGRDDRYRRAPRHRASFSAGFRRAAPFCCGRTLISKGFLREARHLVQTQAPLLAARIDPDVVILGLEPSCLLTLVDEWPELWPSPETRRIVQAAHLAESWLAAQVSVGRCRIELLPHPGVCVFHGHCHQKALVGIDGSRAALQLIPDLRAEALDAGCCGMAGWFGYEKQHYDLSVAIARQELVPALKRFPGAVVAATGTSCRHQIRDLTGRTAYHPLELIAARLRN